MKVTELSKRHIVFSEEGIFKNSYEKNGEKLTELIDLNLHLIMADKYNYVIDTGLGSDHGEQILEYIKKRNDKEIIVIITHFHWDHIWGTHVFKDCKIIAHKNAVKNIEKTYEKAYDKFKKIVKGESKKTLPNITFSDTMEFIDDEIILYYVSGHSDDGISIYDKKEKVLNVGDNIGDSINSPLPYYEVSDEEYKKALDFYKTVDFKTMITGHNKILDKSFLDIVKKELEKKMSGSIKG